MYGLVIEEGLKPDDFYRERHRLIYDAMCRLYGDGEPVDVLTVTDQLERIGRPGQHWPAPILVTQRRFAWQKPPEIGLTAAAGVPCGLDRAHQIVWLGLAKLLSHLPERGDVHGNRRFPG